MTTSANVLVVDDDAGIRAFLEEMLVRDGHCAVAVESGEAALERIGQEEFDIALVDLRLGGVGGMEVLAALRQRSPDTAVIVMTGYATLDTALEALRQGAHDYLFKPCKVVELRESIRTALLKRQQQLQQRGLLGQLMQQLTDLGAVPGAVPVSRQEQTLGELPVVLPSAEDAARFLRQGNLIVDMMRHVITVDGHMLELSPTEFALLAYLVSEFPRVISSHELVRAVQGYECEPWEARETLRYHIHRIRRKVRGITGRTDLIRTVRGVGYTLGEVDVSARF
jgi:DNA-binding response OmpR family regulator